MERFLVIRLMQREPKYAEGVVLDSFKDLEEAKKDAAMRSGVSGEIRFVAEVLGETKAVYPVELAWEPWI